MTLPTRNRQTSEQVGLISTSVTGTPGALASVLAGPVGVALAAASSAVMRKKMTRSGSKPRRTRRFRKRGVVQGIPRRDGANTRESKTHTQQIQSHRLGRVRGIRQRCPDVFQYRGWRHRHLHRRIADDAEREPQSTGRRCLRYRVQPWRWLVDGRRRRHPHRVSRRRPRRCPLPARLHLRADELRARYSY